MLGKRIENPVASTAHIAGTSTKVENLRRREKVGDGKIKMDHTSMCERERKDGREMVRKKKVPRIYLADHCGNRGLSQHVHRSKGHYAGIERIDVSKEMI